MTEATTIFQHPLATGFIYPFFLVFTILFAILEKTKLLGDGKTQINAIVAFVVGLVFISVSSPKEIVANLVLFLTVAIIVAFVAMVLWGFVTGGEPKLLMGKDSNWVTWTIGGIIALGVIIAVIWATGLNVGIFEKLFNQSWSKTFWTNLIFIVVVAAALAVVVKGGGKSGGGGGGNNSD